MNTDIQNLSIEELKSLVGVAQNVLAQRKETEIKGAKEEILRIAKEHDLKVFFEDGGVVKRLRKPKLDKHYVNPNDTSQVWGGQGKRPRWLVDMLKKGHDLESFRSN